MLNEYAREGEINKFPNLVMVSDDVIKPEAKRTSEVALTEKHPLGQKVTAVSIRT